MILCQFKLDSSMTEKEGSPDGAENSNGAWFGVSGSRRCIVKRGFIRMDRSRDDHIKETVQGQSKCGKADMI